MKRIIGNGLLAKSFNNSMFTDDVLLLASGVSYSGETRDCEFSREADLVSRMISKYTDTTIIYFSTCSILDGVDSPYTRHKIAMEEIVSSSSSFYIFRLPQVVGCVLNKTIISFFVEAIIHHKRINIQKYATRSLLDVVDVSRIVTLIVNKKVGINSIFSISPGNSIEVDNILNEISNILNIKPNYNIVDSGVGHDHDTDHIKKILGETDLIFANKYWIDILKKYVPILKAMVISETITNSV